MAFQSIDAELQKCQTELSAYLGTHNVNDSTRSFQLDGKRCVLTMNSTGNVFISVNGVTYRYLEIVCSPKCSTEVPWLYVFEDAAFVGDYKQYGIIRNREPTSSFIGAYNIDNTEANVELDIVTDEFMQTGGGGYTMTRRSRRVRFVRV